MKAGVADYQIVDSQGATEGAVKNGLAEAIADITSTGDTLKANHLKILSDGLILKSQATLFKSLVADFSQEENQVANSLLKKLRAKN
jgi:ATP phosphoribosyltransferase